MNSTIPLFEIAGPLTQERAESAMEWIVHAAGAIAQAKALKEYSEDRLRVVKSIAMSHSPQKSQGMKEVEAYTSLQYQSAVGDKRKAVYEYELLMNKRIAATTMIDMWRTMQASLRASRL